MQCTNSLCTFRVFELVCSCQFVMWWNSMLASPYCGAGTEGIDPKTAGISVRCRYQRWYRRCWYLDWFACPPRVWTKTNTLNQNESWAVSWRVECFSYFAYFFLTALGERVTWLTVGESFWRQMTKQTRAEKCDHLMKRNDFKWTIWVNRPPIMSLCFQIVSAPFGHMRKTQAPPTLTHWEVSSAYKFRRTLFTTRGDHAPIRPAQPRYSN